MKEDYQAPVVEIVKFQEEGIETATTMSSTDVSVWEWFE